MVHGVTFLFLKVMFAEFIAEMGDKTQLMLIAMTSRFKLRDIILGTAIAILVLNALAVAAGSLAGSLVPEWLIKLLAACAFLIFALMSLREDDEEEEEGRKSGAILAPLAVFVTFFLAELGDKTQLTAITFGASEGSGAAVTVWLACSAGLFAADIIGLAAGYLLGSRIPRRAMNYGAFLIFAVFGIVTARTGLLLLLGEGAGAVNTAVIAIAACFAALSAAILIRNRTRHTEPK